MAENNVVGLNELLQLFENDISFADVTAAKYLGKISAAIVKRRTELKMTQKEFAQRTGIAESSISDWKKKRTNPVSDKILIICEVLDVSPYELLSGAEHTGSRSREHDTYVISKGTDVGMLVESCQKLDSDMQKRLRGYLEALKELQ